jgi:hypothetical protein
MSGPQVIEVVVIDSDINDTDDAKGEPDVTVNGKILRMVQAVDGNWYGYFADRDMAITADQTTQVAGAGLDFGTFCDNTSDLGVGGTSVTVTDTEGIALSTGHASSVNGVALTPGVDIAGPSCAAGGFGTTADFQNVLREQKQINPQEPTLPLPAGGQIGVQEVAWPFIQLYELNPTGNVVVQYNKGGGAQTTTLTFDSVDNFAKSELDKSSYGQGDQVHATITDLWLNIDPTDEDSWTFGTTGIGGGAAASTNYQVFDENGKIPTGGNDPTNAGTANLLTAALSSLMCEDNCVLLTTADVQGTGNVITLQDNNDSVLTSVDGPDADAVADPQNPTDWGTGLAAPFQMVGSVPITITEQGPNSGVFGTFDESDKSSVVITTSAARGTSAAFDYNATPVSILVAFAFGSIDIQLVDDEWSSGEEIPVILVDADANLNSRADEDLDFNNPNVSLIPALITGTPTTMFDTTEVVGGTIFTGPGGSLTIVDVQAFSNRAILQASSGTVANGETMEFTRSNSVSDLFDAAPVNDPSFKGFALFNYDFRSLANPGNLSTLTSITLDLTDGVNTVNLGTAVGLQGLIIIDDTTDGVSTFGGWNPNNPLTLIVTLNLSGPSAIPSGTLLPMAADFFGFGFTDDGAESGERVANQIIRLELEETGDNTSTFEGSLEYTMINQLNVLSAATYAGLTTIADDPNFIVFEDLTDEDSPRVNYLDLGADGVSTQISDQQEAPSHSGVVSFSADSFKIADTVIITLEDPDLNVDSDLIDIFTVVPEPYLLILHVMQ